MNPEREFILAAEFMATYKKSSEEEFNVGLSACREMFPAAFDRLLLLAEIITNYRDHLKAFSQADLPAIFGSFQPTADFGEDVNDLLLKLANSHFYREFIEAEKSGDIFKAAARRLVDEHGENITLEHVETALANL